MTTRFAIGVLAPALALCACSGQNTSVAGTSEMSASSTVSSAVSTPSAASSSAASTSAASAPAKGAQPSRDFVVGKWGTNGDCTLAIDLRPDGTSDGPFGAWSYSDGVISFPEEPEFKISVTVLDDNTMESTNASSAKTTQMTRCP